MEAFRCVDDLSADLIAQGKQKVILAIVARAEERSRLRDLVLIGGDSADCQQYADGLITPIRTAANNQAVASAVIGAALGAALGASVGGGRGAGIGAAAGAVSGTNVGVINASFAGMTIQQQFDIAYSQCMYTRGNQIPGFQANTYVLPPPPSYGAARSAPPPGYAAPPSGSAPPPRAS